jgi:hypothetical protein
VLSALLAISNIGPLRPISARTRRTLVALAVLSTTLVVTTLVMTFGFAQVLAGAKLVVLWSLVLICLTLAIFALLVAASSMLPLRRRGFGDWL